MRGRYSSINSALRFFGRARLGCVSVILERCSIIRQIEAVPCGSRLKARRRHEAAGGARLETDDSVYAARTTRGC